MGKKRECWTAKTDRTDNQDDQGLDLDEATDGLWPGGAKETLTMDLESTDNGTDRILWCWLGLKSVELEPVAG